MPRTPNAVRLAFYARLALIMLAVSQIVLLLYLGRTLFIPLFFALLIAILLHPLAAFFERKGIPAGLSCAIPMILFITVLVGLFYFFSVELGNFSKELPQLKHRFAALFQQASDWIAHKYNIDDSKQKEYISKSSHDLIAFGMSTIGSTIGTVLELLIISIFCLLFSFFILYYRELLQKFVFSFFPTREGVKISIVIRNIQDVINHYVLGLCVEMGLIILLSFGSLTLFGIKYALLFALLAAVLNLIPYFGIYTAAAISMVIVFAQGTPNQALETGIIFIVIHIIDSNILLPAIVGGRVKMNPFITLIAIFAGKLFWGIPGMFLFIPITAMLRIVSESIPDFKPWSILLGQSKNK